MMIVEISFSFKNKSKIVIRYSVFDIQK